MANKLNKETALYGNLKAFIATLNSEQKTKFKYLAADLLLAGHFNADDTMSKANETIAELVQE